MLVYKNKQFVMMSGHSDDDWIGNADWVLDDNTQQELEEKIMSLYPNFDFVLNDDGELVDVVATEPPPGPEPEPTIEEKLAELEAYNVTLEEKLTELEAYNATLTECILEMSEYVYN